MMKKQIHVFYDGRVQGVGFRYSAREVARQLKVGGWVRNLSDGRVEMVAQAQEEVLIELLERIGRHFREYIRDSEIEWEAASGNFGEFDIRF